MQPGKAPRKIQHFFSLYRVLAGVEVVIEALFRQQLSVSPLLHNVAVIQHQNEVGVHDGALSGGR